MASRDFRMRYTDAGPWAGGEKGARQRLAYLVLSWLKSTGLSKERAAEVLAADKKWPKDVEPLSASSLQNYGGSTNAEQPEAKGATLSNVWALCDYFNVNAEWLFTGLGAKHRGATMATVDLETELASRVLAEMPDDAPARAGESRRQVAVSGAKCLEVAVNAARAEWLRSDDFSLLATTLDQAVRSARGTYAKASSERAAPSAVERARRHYRQTEANARRLLASYAQDHGYQILRPYPLDEDYAKPVFVSGAVGGYGLETIPPQGHASRVPPHLRLFLGEGPESKRVEKAVKAQQAAAERERIASATPPRKTPRR